MVQESALEMVEAMDSTMEQELELGWV